MNAVHILPLGILDDELLATIEQSVKRTIGVEVRRMEADGTPDYAFDAKRMQYSSELILRNMAKRFLDGTPKVMAVTNVDLFIPMLTFVYGQAQLNGRMSIVSTARMVQEFYDLPPDRALAMARILKESLHELGHTFGLIHCAVQSCLMSIATDVSQIDAKGIDFCADCRPVLTRSVSKWP